MSTCIFCQIAQKKLPGTFLYENADIMIIKDINPQASVHWMVIPKKHVADFAEATDGLIKKIMWGTKYIIRKEKLDKYRIISNGIGNAIVKHFHVHVLGHIDIYRGL